MAGSPLTLLSGLTQGERQQKKRFAGDAFFCLAALLGACSMHKTSSDGCTSADGALHCPA